jgi:hypothetical protein
MLRFVLQSDLLAKSFCRRRIRMNQNMERIQYITRYYGMLQGLKALPFGLLLIALAMRDIGAPVAATVLLLAALAAFFVTGRYYAKHYGSVKRHSRSAATRETVIFLLVVFIVIVLENMLLLPFSLIGAGVAVVFFGLGIKMKTYYYLPLGVILLIVSFLPWVLGVPLTDRMFGSLGFVLSMTIGSVVIIAGLLDHFRLVRTMKSFSGGMDGESH